MDSEKNDEKKVSNYFKIREFCLTMLNNGI